MRVLFYLPVVTPWWFDKIVAHLIRTLAAEAEVHVVVAPLWRNTGIGPEQLIGFEDFDHVVWHVWDDDNHPAFRTSAADDPALLDLVAKIDADLTLCRSADFETPARFPGIVRYIMEAAALPLSTGADWITIRPTMFDHGVMPELDAVEQARLASLFGPVWADLRARHRKTGRDAWRAAMGLPVDRPVVALPLEYEHEENFFARYRRFPRNADLVADVARRLPRGWTLAVTRHPINAVVPDDRMDAVLADHAGSVRLLPDLGLGGQATLALAAHSDGMIVENSKTFSAGAFHGIPLQRTSPFASGDWLNASDDLEAFFARVGDDSAPGAGDADTRAWFGYHVANTIVDPDHPACDAAELIDRIVTPHAPRRWGIGIDRFLGAGRKAAAC